MTPRILAAVIRLAGDPRPATAISPLGRYLTDPGAIGARIAGVLLEAARHRGPVAGPLLAAALLTVVLARRWLRRRQHAALAAGARVITVLAPPLADPAGGQALWGHLAGLLRPRWARLWHGQPHIGFEYTWAATTMTISVWVPGIVPPGNGALERGSRMDAAPKLPERTASEGTLRFVGRPVRWRRPS